VDALLVATADVGAIEPADGDAEDELEEVEDREGQVARRHAEETHC